MNLVVGALAFFSALVLAGTLVSLLALRRAYALKQELDGHQPRVVAAAGPPPEELRELRAAVEALAARVHEMHRGPAPLSAAASDPSVPRQGVNLSNRSQALRMHRLGESPDSIAAALHIPRQEVDLLLKVHRIVLANV